MLMMMLSKETHAKQSEKGMQRAILLCAHAQFCGLISEMTYYAQL